MKFNRFLILFLSLGVFVLVIFSCKKDSKSNTNEEHEKVTVNNDLQQIDTSSQIETNLLTKTETQVTQEAAHRQVVQNQNQKITEKPKTVKVPKASNEEILASPEFKTFMEYVFKLSDESTTEELNYVNSFMDKNDLWKEMRKDQCNLLNNEKIKSDAKVLHFWENRCDFTKAQKKVVKKYNISYDALGKLMNQKRNERQFNPDLAVPDNQ